MVNLDPDPGQKICESGSGSGQETICESGSGSGAGGKANLDQQHGILVPLAYTLIHFKKNHCVLN